MTKKELIKILQNWRKILWQRKAVPIILIAMDKENGTHIISPPGAEQKDVEKILIEIVEGFGDNTINQV